MSDTMTLFEAEKLFELPDPYGKDDVKKAYRALIVEKHPDLRKDVDAETANREASEINAANKLLMGRFDGNPGATYARQRQAAPRAPYPPASAPAPETVTWTWIHVGEYEVPVEEVTWEDLAEDFWEAYHASAVARRRAGGRGYSYADIVHDDLGSFIEGAMWQMAGAFDARESGRAPNAEDAARQLMLENLRAEKRLVDRSTGRVAVFVYAHLLSLVLLVAGGFAGGAAMALAWLLAVVAVFAGDVNFIYPYATIALRRQPYARLDEKFSELYRS